MHAFKHGHSFSQRAVSAI